MRLFAILAVLPVVLSAPTPALAPLRVDPNAESLVPNSYIVKFKDTSGVVSTLNDVISTLDFKKGKPDRVFKNVFSGFTGKLDKAALASIRKNPAVEYVEQDSVVSINAFKTQAKAPWGLARISSRKAGKTGYTYDSTAGFGTCSYIIDTGIQANHPEFGGRAVQLKSFVEGTTDDNGHGTHVAGIVGSNTYGVAKRTKLIGIKVLTATGGGTISSVLAGMELAATDSRTRGCPKGVFVNMSLGGGYSAALNSGARTLVNDRGIFVAVAAGNSGVDASQSSPASEISVFTVGASTSSDKVASFSNYGSLIDIIAPGQDIKSTWINSGTMTLSGTSMATPHVTGLAAYIAGLEGPRTVQALAGRIRNLATTKVLTGVPKGTASRLAFNANPQG